MTRRGGGGGVIAGSVGGEALAATLALGNTTGANDLIVSSGQKIQAANAATGVTLTLEGGVGSAGVGGGFTAAAGSGSTDGGVARIASGAPGSGSPGKIEFSVGGSGASPAADKGFHFLLGSLEILRVAIESSAPTNSAGSGLYASSDASFDFGMLDKVSAGAGKRLILLGQTASDGVGGVLEMRAGEGGGSGNGGGDAEVYGGDGITTGPGGFVNLRPGLSPSGTDGGVKIFTIKTGATQVASGAVANELWATDTHATLPDNVILIGV